MNFRVAWCCIWGRILKEEAMHRPEIDPATVGRARAGDGDAFRELTNPYRNELQLHCYRILGSTHDAEDALQETLLAAWRAFDRFDGRSLRAWLYRIATNRCLNELRDTKRRAPQSAPLGPRPSPSSEPWWLEPYPDHLLDVSQPGPEASYETRESVALSFIAALQTLPPQQRVVLILRDALGFSAAETASILRTTPASVNSALQRARREFPSSRDPHTVPAPRSPEESAIVARFVDAFEQGRIEELVGLLAEDARLTMPPEPIEYRGPQAITEFLQWLGLWTGSVKLVPTRANGQPAFGYYLSDPTCSLFRASGLLVLDLRNDRVAQITRFGDKSLLARFGLPRTLASDQ
jgi:RNA polymerase sigma-70 factor (ECF subfamily)